MKSRMPQQCYRINLQQSNKHYPYMKQKPQNNTSELQNEIFWYPQKKQFQNDYISQQNHKIHSNQRQNIVQGCQKQKTDNRLNNLTQSNNNSSDFNHELKNNNIKKDQKYEKVGSQRQNTSFIKNSAERKVALRKFKYINQLARLDFEEKQVELHTKYTKKSRVSTNKKIKAINQIAEFNDNEQESFEGFKEMMNYKYGNNSKNIYHYENNSVKEHQFCCHCDTIYHESMEQHKQKCQQIIRQNSVKYHKFSNDYLFYSIMRIELCLGRLNSRQSQDLFYYLQQIKQSKNRKNISPQSKQDHIREGILQVRRNSKQDPLICAIADKIMALL